VKTQIVNIKILLLLFRLQVKRFFTEHLHGENLRSVSQALDKIEMNIDWMARNKETVVDWLKEAANQ